MKTSSLRKLTLSLSVALSIGSYGILRADLGGNNPTGTSGEFNGSVTTGCSYDPFTGNAKRWITDIVVPGAVGAYPLAFTRTINTRTAYPDTWAAPFGRPGGWRHSYQWEPGAITLIFPNCEAGGVPDHYAVTYPDGREVTFGADGASTTLGIGDSFTPITDPHATSADCYLLLSDGGRVHFIAEINRDCVNGSQEATFLFGLAGIIDPYGQEAILSSTIGPGPYPSTFTFIVTEPAGRNLSLCWKKWSDYPAPVSWVIDRVEERAAPNAPVSRTVKYNYVNFNGTAGLPALTSVDYFGDPTLTALYTYQASNAGSGNPPLIKTCNDTMYPGAMSKIAYDFAAGQPHGFLLRERYFDGVDAINGPAVSTLAAPNEIQRSETRGDGPMRTFNYNSDLGLLMSWTDFQNHTSSQEHYLNAQPVGFVRKVIDARLNPTEFGRDPLTGKVTQIKHPLTPSDLNGPGIMEMGYDANHPYQIEGVRNERGYSITYYREGNTAEVTGISYPDYHPNPPVYYGHEGFRYNPFGQVTRHERQNGNYEHMQYDSRGLLIYRWNPTASQTAPDAPSTVLPKTTFEYYALDHPWRDRVKTVTDPRGKTTTFEYDHRLSDNAIYSGRGLVSRITHHDNAYLTFGYDERGNKVWEENELRQRTTYIYDDYNRVIKVETPLPDGRTATTTYAYNPTYQPDVPSLSPYLHTARTPTKITTPTGVVVENRYDENGRLKQSTRGPTAPEPAITRYGYDEVGNLTSVRDPRNYETVIEYDERNRRTKVTGPPISAAGNDHYITKWLYDPASNVRKIILPDDTEIHREYDEMNRLKTNDLTNDTHQEHRVTLYTYWPSGQLRTLKDPNNHLTVFEYDERDLKTKMTYPNQPGSPPILEGWVYDEKGNMKERPTIGGPKQVFSYDDRNRLKTMRWSNGIDFSDFGYDEAGRLTSAINPYSSITRQYNNRSGRLELDRQVLATALNPPSMTITPIDVVSRKSHGSAGSFDINLPLTGTPGIECRIGSNYTLVLTFSDPVSVGGATVSSGIGSVITATASGNVVTVNLTDVSNAQVISIRVFGLSDGTNMGELIIPMHVLVGATTGQSVVNEDDSEQTDSREGEVANSTNFRSDVNTDGFINSDDVTEVAITAGADVPAPPAAGPQADVWYDYDDDGKVRLLLVPAVSDYYYKYSYDGLGRLEWITRITNPNEVRYQYSYDPSSNVIGRKSYTNNTSLSFIRDEVNRITEETILSGDDPLSQLHYAYDRMSRLESTLRDEDGLLDRFGYNFAGELNSAEHGLHWGIGGWQNPRAAVSYAYDNAGNRSSVNGTIYAPNALNQYIWAQGSAVDNGNQHEISSYQGKNYSYLADTQLSGVSSGIGSAPGNSYRLGYDALGRTVRRTMNGEATYFIYAGPHPIIEYDASGNMLANTLYGMGVDEIISRNNHGAGQFLMQDRTNSTVAVTGSKGELLERYRYDAFGTPEILDEYGNGRPNNESAINNRFLFTGREWVSRFGFYENRARAYHPGLGRFMSEDPLGFAAGDANLFRYCGNDPVNWSDPSGLDQNTLTIGAGFGVMITWGTNNGQSNFGWYVGLGAGISYSYTPSTSEYVFPGVIPGIAGQYTEGIGELASVNLSMLNSTRDGTATATTGLGYGKHQLQFGVTVDANKSPPYGSAPPSYGWLDGAFFGIGATSYGPPKAPPPGGTTYLDPNFSGATMERIIVTSTYLPSFYSFRVDSNTFFSPGFGSGLNSGSHGGASAASVQSALFQTLAGIPGGGAQWGEGYRGFGLN